VAEMKCARKQSKKKERKLLEEESVYVCVRKERGRIVRLPVRLPVRHWE